MDKNEEYDFTKPPTATSIYKLPDRKKSHYYFAQGSAHYAAFMFQSDEWRDYFRDHIQLVYYPEGVPDNE